MVGGRFYRRGGRTGPDRLPGRDRRDDFGGSWDDAVLVAEVVELLVHVHAVDELIRGLVDERHRRARGDHGIVRIEAVDVVDEDGDVARLPCPLLSDVADCGEDWAWVAI